jgi:2-polyprenyl-6-methoxyphenol hydroxylase-like FAD-dependent oxidoreductase
VGGRHTHRGLRVLVIGGGIGGLCLAQGLRQHDVDVTVYERDESALGRRQGYRLRISPEGEQALRDCLPRRAQELLVATANMRYEKGLAAYDERLTPQWAPKFEDSRGDAPDKVDAVDRVTLRRILLAGLEDRVRFGKRFTRYAQLPGGRVEAWFDDGTHDAGDVLVAADGTNSRVRTQFGAEHALHDLGVRAILSRTPMAAAIRAGMPDVLRDRFTYVIGADGFHLGMMPMVFRTEPRKAAAELWPGLEFDDVEDYYMSVFSVHRGELGLTDEEFFAMTGRQLCDLVLDRTSGWHPDLHGVFGQAEPEQTFPVALRATLPILPWKSGTIVPLGDAVHAMPPSGGVGANTAVRDASALCRALVAVDRGKQSLAEAVAAYEEAMTGYATEAVVMSLKIAQWSMKKLDFVP